MWDTGQNIWHHTNMPQLKTININFRVTVFFLTCFSPSLWLPLLVNTLTCLPLWVTEDRMVLRVLKPMAMSNRWAAKKKLLKCPKIDMVVYQIRYRKFCSKKTKKNKFSSSEIIFINIKIQAFRFLMETEKISIRKKWLLNEQFSQRKLDIHCQSKLHPVSRCGTWYRWSSACSWQNKELKVNRSKHEHHSLLEYYYFPILERISKLYGQLGPY